MVYDVVEIGGSSSLKAVLCDKDNCAAARKKRDVTISSTKIDTTKSSERSQMEYEPSFQRPK